MSIFGTPNASPYVKDGVHNYVVNGKQDAVNPKCRQPETPGNKGCRALQIRN
jgi:hypothetical protein